MIARKIATYSRVSSAHQEEEQTIQNQLGIFKIEAQKKNYEIVNQYTDEGWSGDILARPALDLLRQDARLKKWDAVLIYDPDRLARRYSYQELVMDELREAGIEVIFITVPAPKNSEEKILYGVRGIFAEYERTKITERFRLGRLRKLQQGTIIYQGSYGFIYTKKQGSKPGFLEIIEEEARVVRMIFDWIESGFSIRKVVKTLFELKIKPRKSISGAFNTSMIAKILHNTAYIGEAYYNKRMSIVPLKPRKNIGKYIKNAKCSSKLRPKDEWIKISVPKIIDRVQFERVQNILKKNLMLSNRNAKYNYLLSAKVFCVCGAKCGAQSQKHGKNRYYRCTARCISYPLPSPCQRKSIIARHLESIVWAKITELMTSQVLLERQLQIWRSKNEQKRAQSWQEIPSLEREVSSLKNEENRIDMAYTKGIITLDKYEKYLNPIKEKLARLVPEINTLKNNQASVVNIIPSIGEIDVFTEHAKSVLFSYDFEKQRKIILKTVHKVVASEKGVVVYGYIPIGDNDLCSHGRSNVNINKQNSCKAIPFELTAQLGG